MNRNVIVLLVSLGIAIGSLATPAYAQGRGNGRGGDQGQSQGPGPGQGQRQGQGQGQGQGRSSGAGPSAGRSGSPVMQQAEIRDRLRSRDIYGRELMTREEQQRYRDRVNATTSDREWARIRQEHMNDIRERARQQGRSLDPPVYGEHMLTRQEREQYQKRLAAAQSEAERTRLRSEHQAMIRDRARLLGIDPPPLDQ